MAYAPQTLKFLCPAREHLNWKWNQSGHHAFDGANSHLHFMTKKALDCRTKCAKQNPFIPTAYAVRWWMGPRRSKPADVDPIEMMKAKIKWRYAKEVPRTEWNGKIYPWWLHVHSTKNSTNCECKNAFYIASLFRRNKLLCRSMVAKLDARRTAPTPIWRARKLEAF